MNFNVDKSDILYEGKVFDLKVDEITYKNTGNKGIRQVAVHPGGSVILPVTEDGKIVFVTQYRYPVQKDLLELPAGKLEENEDPLICATRELTEETGYTADKIEYLGYIYTSPGFSTEKLNIYLATGLKAGEHNREEGEEGMTVKEYSLSETDNLIAAGLITDAKTICAIYQFRVKTLDKS